MDAEPIWLWWVICLFGGFLVLTGLRLATAHQTELHPEDNPLLRLVRRVFPITDGRRVGGRRARACPDRARVAPGGSSGT